MPRSLLVEVLSMAVARFLRVTRAPGTAAFDESVIVPPTLPVAVWARIGCAHKSRMRAVVKIPLPKQELTLCKFFRAISPKHVEQLASASTKRLGTSITRRVSLEQERRASIQT